VALRSTGKQHHLNPIPHSPAAQISIGQHLRRSGELPLGVSFLCCFKRVEKGGAIHCFFTASFWFVNASDGYVFLGGQLPSTMAGLASISYKHREKAFKHLPRHHNEDSLCPPDSEARDNKGGENTMC